MPLFRRREMLLWWSCVSLLVLRSSAFLSTPSLIASSRPYRSIRLSSSSSSNSNNPVEDDEISKLIGKRSQIKRKKKEELEEPEIKSVEPLEDLDLDKLPQFKTERPVRRAKPKDDDNDEQEDDTKASDSPIIDYKADYEDENDLHIPNRIGISTIAWGDPKRNFVSGGKLTKRMLKSGKFVPGDVQLAYTQLLEGGVTFVETSSAYGAVNRKNKLSAHDILQQCLEEQPDDLPDAMLMENLAGPAWTKAYTGSKVESQLVAACERMGTSSVDVLQLPKSFLFPSALLAKAMVVALDSGWCNYVGVRDINSAGSLRRLCSKLDTAGYSLTTASFDYSLTKPQMEYMIDVCKDANVIPLVTNPLDHGLASGTITASNPSGGQVAGGPTQYSFKELEKLQPLHSVQETVAERVRTRVIREMRDLQDRFKSRYGPPPQINTDITTTQVALNYIVAKGGVPLVEVNSPKQAEEVLGSLGWTLVDDEVDMLDAVVALCRLK